MMMRSKTMFNIGNITRFSNHWPVSMRIPSNGLGGIPKFLCHGQRIGIPWTVKESASRWTPYDNIIHINTTVVFMPQYPGKLESNQNNNPPISAAPNREWVKLRCPKVASLTTWPVAWPKIGILFHITLAGWSMSGSKAAKEEPTKTAARVAGW